MHQSFETPTPPRAWWGHLLSVTVGASEVPPTYWVKHSAPPRETQAGENEVIIPTFPPPPQG